MTAEAEFVVDVGGSQTLVGVDHGDVSLLAAVPDGASEREVAAALDALERELAYVRRVSTAPRSTVPAPGGEDG